jgi:pyruvate,water dikinase
VPRHFDLSGGLAVRSSADVEDGSALSYAGQFTSVLDVATADGVVEATEAVVRSAGAASRYPSHNDAGPVRMGVLVQQMVPPVVSGVAFTVDPATGLHDVVVEGVAGRGDALVQDGVTPQRWAVRGSGTLLIEPDDPLLPRVVLLDLAEQARRAARRLGQPLDLEWVFDGQRVVWVQARPVTVSADVAVYSRRIARDVLPGEVLPLVLTVNSEVVNPAWLDVLRSLVGQVDVDPGRMARTFGYRAYFDMTAFRDVFTSLGLPEDSLERLLGLPGLEPGRGMRPGPAAVRHVPRAARQVMRWVRTDGSIVRQQLSAAESDGRRDEHVDLSTLDAEALLERFEHAIDRARGVARLSIEVPMVHAAHEALLGRLVGDRGRGQHLRLAHDDERATLDPSLAIRRLAATLATLDPDTTSALSDDGTRVLGRAGAAVATELHGLLETFGHLAERSNNLSVTTWAEDPSIPLRLALACEGDSASQPPALDTAAAVAAAVRPLRPLVGRLCDRTGELRLLREQVSLGYGRTYMRLRPLARALGTHLWSAGHLADPDDVFLLTLDEVRAAARGGVDDLATTAARRRTEVAQAAGLELPDVIIGEQFVPRQRSEESAQHVWGTAASAGRHTGTLRVLHSLAESDRLQAGDVLAVETSDVAWTPLFDRAGAVVAESGGLLAHAAVVARERGIPCVVSAAGCLQLPDGSRVEVDGYVGSIRVVT